MRRHRRTSGRSCASPRHLAGIGHVGAGDIRGRRGGGTAAGGGSGRRSGVGLPACPSPCGRGSGGGGAGPPRGRRHLARHPARPATVGPPGLGRRGDGDDCAGHTVRLVVAGDVRHRRAKRRPPGLCRGTRGDAGTGRGWPAVLRPSRLLRGQSAVAAATLGHTAHRRARLPECGNRSPRLRSRLAAAGWAPRHPTRVGGACHGALPGRPA